jgi:predicted nucleotidyltransferase component of viral defense system
MIPKPVLDHWRQHAPFPLDQQVEQDLIISRSLVEIFNHEHLKDRIAFRGGTALNKLIFPKPLRYSEDIDLNRLEKGAAKPLIISVREAMMPVLGKESSFKATKNSLKFWYSYQAIDGTSKQLKIEINVRETLPDKPLARVPYKVESDYFTGNTTIVAFDTEEMIGSKIRALYQREKGRDLFDLYELSKMNHNWDNIVASFKILKIGASKKQFEQNLELKMKNAQFLEDILPLLPAGVTYDPQAAYKWFLEVIIPKL